MAKITGTVTLSDERNPWDKNGHAWKVELRYRGRKMTVPFYTGSALGEPSIPEIVECLALDAVGYDNSPDFESWAVDYGYDTDSRKTEQLFRAVAAQADRLRKLLGDDYTQILSYQPGLYDISL